MGFDDLDFDWGTPDRVFVDGRGLDLDDIELTDAPGGVVMEMPDGWAAYFQGLFAADADGWLVVV